MPGRLVEKESEIASLGWMRNRSVLGRAPDQIADVSLALDRGEEVERRELEFDGDLGDALGSRLPVRRKNGTPAQRQLSTFTSIAAMFRAASPWGCVLPADNRGPACRPFSPAVY